MVKTCPKAGSLHRDVKWTDLDLREQGGDVLLVMLMDREQVSVARYVQGEGWGSDTLSREEWQGLPKWTGPNPSAFEATP